MILFPTVMNDIYHSFTHNNLIQTPIMSYILIHTVKNQSFYEKSSFYSKNLAKSGLFVLLPNIYGWNLMFISSDLWMLFVVAHSAWTRFDNISLVYKKFNDINTIWMRLMRLKEAYHWSHPIQNNGMGWGKNAISLMPLM